MNRTKPKRAAIGVTRLQELKAKEAKLRELEPKARWAFAVVCAMVQAQGGELRVPGQAIRELQALPFDLRHEDIDGDLVLRLERK